MKQWYLNYIHGSPDSQLHNERLTNVQCKNLLCIHFGWSLAPFIGLFDKVRGMVDNDLCYHEDGLQYLMSVLTLHYKHKYLQCETNNMCICLFFIFSIIAFCPIQHLALFYSNILGICIFHCKWVHRPLEVGREKEYHTVLATSYFQVAFIKLFFPR